MKIVQLIESKDGFTIDSSSYPSYVNSVRERIPKNLIDFMTSTWHYDHMDSRCPHDANINSIDINEVCTDGVRTSNINIELLGAFSNKICISYFDVFRYKFEKSKAEWPESDYSHGDWLVDELLLADNGLLSHEIILINARIEIVCKVFKYDATETQEN